MRKPMRALLVCGVVLAALLVVVCVHARRFLFSPVLTVAEGETADLYIPTGADFDDVLTLLNAKSLLADEDAFVLMSNLMSYTSGVKPGRYKLSPSLSARSLVRILRAGAQTPVNVTFNNLRTLESLAGVVARYVEADSVELLAAMGDSSLLAGWGLTRATAPAIFLPDTYSVWWNEAPRSFVVRMRREFDAFWSPRRLAKADSLGLTPVQVSILASIVEEESNLHDEQRTIASVYLNRLRIAMPLQACPTLKFAIGDFSIKRVTFADMKVESPYNTYKYAGLPPGPIRIPSKGAIMAVLEAPDTDFLYFCARPDGSGRHDFARTLAQHQRNAARYHQALNSRRVYR